MMYLRTTHRPAIQGWLVALAMSALLLGPLPEAAAQLRHVVQIAYGMDCEPCARSVQRRMERFNGVKKVTLSLNRGAATIELDPDNQVTLHAIRDSIRRGGFTPQNARIEVAGTIERDDDGDLLVIFGTDERYRLKEADEDDVEAASADEELIQSWRKAWLTLQQHMRDQEEADAKQRILLFGRVPRSEQSDARQTLPLYVREFLVLGEEEKGEPGEH